MSQLSKCIVSAVVGSPEDKSFTNQSTGDVIQCFIIPCQGTVNGAPSPFNVKIYGKGSDSKIKAGVEFNGKFGKYQDETWYEAKKADNPHMYAAPNPAYAGGGRPASGNRPSGAPRQANHENNGLKLAVEIVTAHFARSTSTETAEELAEKALKIARDKFVPFLSAVSKRHDDESAKEENKQVQDSLIRQLIQTNNLTANVQAAGATTGLLAGMYEQSGKDADKFVQLIRAQFAAPVANPVDMDEDSIPF